MKRSHDVNTFREGLSAALRPYYGRNESGIIAGMWVDFVLGGNTAKRFSGAQLAQALAGADRLFNKEPIQYVMGWAHFYGRDFRVDPSVLIPRPETEGLMLWLVDEYHWVPGISTGLDIGTGSGCIAISLEKEWDELGKRVKITGIDISEAALNIARQNAVVHKSECQFSQVDLFQAGPEAFENLDFIVSNPPYVPASEASEIQPHVLEYEPRQALFVPDQDPLLFYRQIGLRAMDWLKTGGRLYVETHADHGKAVEKLFADQGFESVVLRKDLQGRDRMVRAEKA